MNEKTIRVNVRSREHVLRMITHLMDRHIPIEVDANPGEDYMVGIPNHLEDSLCLLSKLATESQDRNPTCTELHRKALAAWDESGELRKLGQHEKAREQIKVALSFSKQSAALLKDRLDQEPSRSLIYQTAAAFAIDCGEYRQAEELIGQAIAGTPPEENLRTLRFLLKDVWKFMKFE